MIKIVGIVYAKGEYEGYSYNNVYIHALHDVKPEKGCGQYGERYCMARDTFDALYKNPSQLIGKTIVDVYYARGGKKVKSLEIR